MLRLIRFIFKILAVVLAVAGLTLFILGVVLYVNQVSPINSKIVNDIVTFVVTQLKQLKINNVTDNLAPGPLFIFGGSFMAISLILSFYFSLRKKISLK